MSSKLLTSFFRRIAASCRKRNHTIAVRSPFIAQNFARTAGLGLKLAAIQSYGAFGTHAAAVWSGIWRFGVAGRTLQDSFLLAGRVEWYHLKDRAELKAACDRLQKNGVTNLFHIPGGHLLGDDGEGSTDGSLPNDLGFLRQTEIFAKVLEPLLPTTK